VRGGSVAGFGERQGSNNKKGLSMKSFCARVLLCLFVLFLAAGCAEETTPSTPSSGDLIMPLNVGTSMTLLERSLDTLGTVIGVDTSVFTVMHDTTINSEKWFVINSEELLANRSNGLWYGVHVGGRWIVSPGLLAKYPGQAGDTWLGPDSLSASLAAVNAPTAVPFGAFSCYRYTYSDAGQLLTVRYLSVNKGLIMDEFYSKTASGRSYVDQRRSLMGQVLTKSVGVPATSGERLFRMRMR
jgi:hypothetical protein